MKIYLVYNDEYPEDREVVAAYVDEGKAVQRSIEEGIGGNCPTYVTETELEF